MSSYHGWTHGPKAAGGTDPIHTDAVLFIKIFADDTTLTAGDGRFIFECSRDMDDRMLTDAEAYVTTDGGATIVQIRNVTQSHDMLSTRITIDSGDLNSKDASAQPVINTSNADVQWGDHIAIDVDTAGAGAMGLGVMLTFSPAV